MNVPNQAAYLTVRLPNLPSPPRQSGFGKALSRGKDFPSFPLCRAGTPLFSRSGEEGLFRNCLPYPCGSAAPDTYHVNFCLPGDVKNCLPTNVKNSLPYHVKFCLPHHVKFWLPRHVKKCLTFAPSRSPGGRTFPPSPCAAEADPFSPDGAYNHPSKNDPQADLNGGQLDSIGGRVDLKEV